MAIRYQLVMNCADPDLMARFWAAALGYELEPPPEGFDTWDDWRRDKGCWDLGAAPTASSTPRAARPASGSRYRRTGRRCRTGSTSTSTPAAGGRSGRGRRKARIDAAARRLFELGATILVATAEGPDFYAVGMKDPEGNEFDIN